ncbi:MAG: hypothetical protein DRN15_00145 [Thermoprotei archaeon]|nr:MAG: hypothetical protein DRN15_00145 [Thermoprotei archaeon]RLF25742.1 MAG: hypothetical protein DRM97_00785 [Thermoprotei archaeon]
MSSKPQRVCSVKGCDKPAVRSISATEAMNAGLDVEAKRGRIYLCKEHYKVYKKATKVRKQLEKWRLMG